MEEITQESIKSLNIRELALKKEFGALVFNVSYPLLEKIKKIFVELEDFDYENQLTLPEVQEIINYKNRFVDYLKRLSIFDITQPTPKDIHDNFENEIINFYDEFVKYSRPTLYYLKQEAADKSRDKKELQKQQREALQASTEYKKLLKNLKGQLKILEKRKREIESGHGVVASKILAQHFAKQANDYARTSQYWFNLGTIFYFIMGGIVIVNLVAYIIIFCGSKVGKIPLQTKDFFTLEYGIIWILLVTMLWYAIRFASRAYNIHSNLEAINKHRKNVAQTLDDYLATNPDADTRSEMIKQGTEAMFKHISSGYVSKGETKDIGPINEVVNTFLNPNKLY